MSKSAIRKFRNDVRPNWCPGCGDYSVQSAIQRAGANLGLYPEQLVLVSGIGCSGRISGYIRSYGYHGVHGRALPIAQGVKMANRDLTVVAVGGDGDGFAIGLGHTVHAMRRNMDITYIVMDNQVYGLTKGQTSPRSPEGFVTSSSPDGSIEKPIQPMEVALVNGATFVAQSFSSDVVELTSLIERAIEHKGFSIINVYSPCVTYNKVNTYDWFRENLIDTSEVDNYDTTNRIQAIQTLIEHNGLVTGVLYEENKPSYQDLIQGFAEKPITKQNLYVEEGHFNQLVQEFM